MMCTTQPWTNFCRFILHLFICQFEKHISSRSQKLWTLLAYILHISNLLCIHLLDTMYRRCNKYWKDWWFWGGKFDSQRKESFLCKWRLTMEWKNAIEAFKCSLSDYLHVAFIESISFLLNSQFWVCRIFLFLVWIQIRLNVYT